MLVVFFIPHFWILAEQPGNQPDAGFFGPRPSVLSRGQKSYCPAFALRAEPAESNSR